ncbi:MAG TPA: type II secretion system protein GspK [Polyangiaceae bacterium]|nr:type II secretion system protein GspK [Polyangiaceae bacterium]
MTMLRRLLSALRSTPPARQSERLRRLRLRRRRRGVALILVLSSLTILTVMLSEIQDESAAELGSALSARDALVAEYAARSGVNLSRLLIAAEPTIRKTLSPLFLMMSRGGGAPQIPVWEFTDRVMGAFNGAEGTESFKSMGGFDMTQGKNLGMNGAHFELTVVDEDSKINVNEPARGGAFNQSRLAAQLIGLIGSPTNDPMFEGRDADGQFSDRQAICSSVIDWTDPDQDTYICDPNNPTAQTSAAEDSFYQLLKRPYPRKNAAFDSLQELHKLRGFSDDFWATFVEPDPDAPDKRTLTVWGQGTINVNTANPQTLLAFICSQAPAARLCVDPAEATKFLGAVAMARGLLRGVPTFFSPKMFIKALSAKPAPAGGAPAAAQGGGPIGGILGMMQLEPVTFLSESQAEKMISVESKLFSIYATGVVKSGKRETRVRIHAVVDFRNAPPPGAATPLNQLSQAVSQLNASGAAPTPATPAPGAAPNLNDPNQLLAALLKPTPGGSIIHYKVE